jgi:hypothetical protein
MIIDFNIWKKTMRDWAEKNDASFNLVKTPSMGDNSDYFTIEIKKEVDVFDIISINQSSIGGFDNISISFLKFETKIPNNINYDLSIYPKGFFEKFFRITKIKTGNKIFDNKFGIYTTNKEFATYFFSNEKIQTLFLKNKFIIFNIQKGKSLITFKSMETKFYTESELQKLLNDFIFILDLLEKYK